MFVTSAWLAHAYNLCENCTHNFCLDSEISQDARHYIDDMGEGYVGLVRLIDERKVKQAAELINAMSCKKCKPPSQVAEQPAKAEP